MMLNKERLHITAPTHNRRVGTNGVFNNYFHACAVRQIYNSKPPTVGSCKPLLNIKKKRDMNLDKYIIIGGPNHTDILKALQQFSNNYSDSGVTNGLELHKSKSENNLFVVNVSKEMDLETYKYLINYLKYPQDITYKIDIRGFWTIGKGDKIKNNHIDQRAMFYISPNDNEYDNVFGIFKGGDKTIKFGFAYREEYKVQDNKEIDFNEPELFVEDFELVQTINSDPTLKKKKEKGCLVTFTIMILAMVGLTLLIL